MNCQLSKMLCALAKIVSLLINYQTPEDLASPQQLKDGDEYDFIIVGAGPAGCVLANRLSEIADWEILLIEAGGEEPGISKVPSLMAHTWNSRLNWHYESEPHPSICNGEPCFFSTGKGLGGGSVHNDMIYYRGLWDFYDRWEATGAEGWGYNDVLQYYKKFENNLDSPYNQDKEFHSTGGPQAVSRLPYTDKNVRPLIEAFKELGYPERDLNGRNQTGVMEIQYFQKNGVRQSSGTSYLHPIRNKRPNLTIVTNVRVTQIIINSDKRAEGVRFVGEKDRSISGKLRARKEVILSAGAINSPQILMLSGIGPRKTLESLRIKVVEDLKVGYNFQNHMGSSGISIKLSEQQKTTKSDVGVFTDILQYSVSHNGPLSGQGTSQVLAVINSLNNTNETPDIAVFFGAEETLLNEKYSSDALSPLCYYDRAVILIENLKPKFIGRIDINTTDPFAQPLIYPWKSAGEDNNDVFISGYKVIEKLFNTKALKQLNITIDPKPRELCRHLEFLSDSYYECLVVQYGDFFNHFSGSCKMGSKDDDSAVVDPRLKVRNVHGLRVVDCSIIPILGTGNTNAVTLMIGEKGADLIKQDWLTT
ncbi:glucose dehydrogenase [FAD, quinone]-like [Periplaneta americana]|uniref:glucose dehydrogenase [FAD, quinone]-like n=1 Tax=Periplaneta americana TaxID=6978 RepID=UPI0037E8AEA9